MIAGASYTLVVQLDPGITEVQVYVKKPSNVSFDEVPLLAGDFLECTDVPGFYNIKVKKEFTNEVGTYIFKVVGYELEEFFQKECYPQPLSSVPAPGVCIVTGNVRTISGNYQYYKNTVISAHPLKLPKEVNGSLILGSKVHTYADHEGFFSLPLIVGMTVLIEIPDSGVRFQAVIPEVESIRIEELMP